MLGRMSHPNIVTVYEHGQSGGYYYLLMEYVDGVNLRHAMQAGPASPRSRRWRWCLASAMRSRPLTRTMTGARTDEIVLRTLEKERDLRQLSAVEGKNDVHRAATTPPIASQPVRVPFTPGFGPGVAPRLLAISGGILLLGSALFTRGSTQGVLASIALVPLLLGLRGILHHRKKLKKPLLPLPVAFTVAVLVFLYMCKFIVEAVQWGTLRNTIVPYAGRKSPQL